MREGPPLRVCLIGLGSMGEIHRTNLLRHPGIAVTGIVSEHLWLQGLRQVHDIPLFQSIQYAIEAGQIDAFWIASSSEKHPDQIRLSAEAGKFVFVEKPVAISESGIMALEALESSSRDRICVGYNRRLDLDRMRLRAKLGSGELGRIRAVSIVSRDHGCVESPGDSTIESVFCDSLSHDFDAMEWLLGEPLLDVFCRVSTFGEKHRFHTADVSAATPSGILCHLHMSRYASYGYDQRIEVLTDGAAVVLDNVRSSSITIASPEARISHDFFDQHADRYRATYVDEIDHFLSFANGHAPPIASLKEGSRAVRIALAALASSRSGVPVTPVAA